MRTLLKLIFVIVILTVAGLIALPFFIDPNDYKQEISDQVEKATGRQLTLEGDIELSVFPWIALELGSLSLSNAKGFKADTFAKVNAVEVRIKLMPLLNKQLEMDTIILDGLVLNLEKNKAGKTNWDDLVSSESTTNTADKKESASSESGAPALAAISIAGVQLSNANIIWDDASTGDNYQLKNLNLTTDPLVPGKATALNMDFNITSAKQQAKAHISLTTNVMVDLEKQQYSLTDLDFTTQAEGADLPFSKADIALSADINADMLKQLVTIDGLSLTVKANKDQQEIDATLSTSISANLANQQTSLTAVDLSATITDPALPGGKADITLKTNIISDQAKQSLSLSDLALSIQDLLINGQINVSKLSSDNPNVAGNLNVSPFNLRQLANNLAIELPIMADDSTLSLVQLDTEFTASSKHFNAKQLNVVLDQSNLKGQFSITDFINPAITFKLVLDEINADRYLPPVSKEEQIATPPAATAAAGASQLPLETLRAINAKGTLDIGKLKVSGTHSENIHIKINAAKGLIKLAPLSANLYQGQYNGNVNLDAKGKTLKLSLNERLKNVQVGPLLKDLTGDDKLSGTANAQAKLTGNGATVEQIKQTLTGSGKFSFTDGAIKGINIAESIRKAKAAMSGKTLPDSDAPLKTDFASLTGSFTAKNGIINNQDFLVMSPLLRINGAGTVDLPKEAIDYGLKVSIVGTSKGQEGVELAELKGLTIPVKITGTFDNPKPTVDLASLFKEKATAEIKAKLADKLKDEVGSDLGGLLGGLLGTETAAPTETTPDTTEASTEPAPKSTEDQLKDALSDKLKSFF
ncbi:MAG: AsmA family protein [Piscirickettsiaceae bacterium]|nr:AsmA family protein [Piscirickettsiaceae bacterium]